MTTKGRRRAATNSTDRTDRTDRPIDPATESAADPTVNPTADPSVDRAIARALGVELRRTRIAHDWSRDQFVARLRSGIGYRTLVSYELGQRQLTVARLVELAGELDTTAPELLGRALLAAQIELSNLVLRIDLRRLLADTHTNPQTGTSAGTSADVGDRFGPIAQWARNRLIEQSRGVVELPPFAVREMAALIGCAHADLARHLTQFSPDVLASSPGNDTGRTSPDSTAGHTPVQDER